MKGTILGYQPENGEGMISGEDGKRYGFKGTDFRGNVLTLKSGQGADFELSDSGAAIDIYVLQHPPVSAPKPTTPAQPQGSENDGTSYLRGTVLGYHPESGDGIISGDDGQRYSFKGTEFKGNVLSLRTGQGVDFEVGPDNTAHAIYMIQMSGSGSGSLDRVFSSDGEKNRILAGILALLLGGIGAHKFYLGNTQEGIVLLVVSIVGLFMAFIPNLVVGVIILVEGIKYLTMTDADFQQTYVIGRKKWF